MSYPRNQQVAIGLPLRDDQSDLVTVAALEDATVTVSLDGAAFAAGDGAKTLQSGALFYTPSLTEAAAKSIRIKAAHASAKTLDITVLTALSIDVPAAPAGLSSTEALPLAHVRKIEALIDQIVTEVPDYLTIYRLKDPTVNTLLSFTTNDVENLKVSHSERAATFMEALLQVHTNHIGGALPYPTIGDAGDVVSDGRTDAAPVSADDTVYIDPALVYFDGYDLDGEHVDDSGETPVYVRELQVTVGVVTNGWATLHAGASSGNAFLGVVRTADVAFWE